MSQGRGRRRLEALAVLEKEGDIPAGGGAVEERHGHGAALRGEDGVLARRDAGAVREGDTQVLCVLRIRIAI